MWYIFRGSEEERGGGVNGVAEWFSTHVQSYMWWVYILDLGSAVTCVAGTSSIQYYKDSHSIYRVVT